MKIAILSKNAEYAKMLEYELCDRGYTAFAFDGNQSADAVICDIDSINIENKVFTGIKLITFSKNEGAMLKRPFAISALCSLLCSEENDNNIDCSFPVLDKRKRKLLYSAMEISLSPLEAKLYNELISANGDTVSNERILSLFESCSNNGSNRIRVLVNSLREKIKKSFSLDIIENVRGEGYRLSMNK